MYSGWLDGVVGTFSIPTISSQEPFWDLHNHISLLPAREIYVYCCILNEYLIQDSRYVKYLGWILYIEDFVYSCMLHKDTQTGTKNINLHYETHRFARDPRQNIRCYKTISVSVHLLFQFEFRNRSKAHNLPFKATFLFSRKWKQQNDSPKLGTDTNKSSVEIRLNKVAGGSSLS